MSDKILTANSQEVSEFIQSLGVELRDVTEVHLALVAGRPVELTITRLVHEKDFEHAVEFVEQFNLVKKDDARR